MCQSLPEISRNLSRLRKQKFVRKDCDGNYHLTNFGSAVLCLFPGFVFLVSNKDYSLNHSLASIPKEIFCRIGELMNSSRVKGFLRVIDLIDSCLLRAEKRIFIMGDRILLNHAKHIEEKAEKGVEFSCLFPEKYTLPIKFAQSCTNHLSKCRRYRNKINIFILITENETIIAFPDNSNKIDYNDIIHGIDKRSMKWAEDLSNYFVRLSEQQSEYAE
jgi:predicted transcriptional regulator